MDPVLVVLRGNSAAGKSTLAGALQTELGQGTANIGQDYFRRRILREHDVAGAANIGLIAAAARHCLRSGWNVVLEGIFPAAHYREMLRELAAWHGGQSRFYYLTVELAESQRRHAGREWSSQVPPERLREWYLTDDVLDLAGERVLSAHRRTDELLADIIADLGPVPPPTPEQVANAL